MNGDGVPNRMMLQTLRLHVSTGISDDDDDDGGG